MTVGTGAPSLPVADESQIRWRLEQLRDRRYPGGVVALAARPVWDGPSEISLASGGRAAIRLGTSVLAIREAITLRSEYDWVVVLTDLGPNLPNGVLEHLLPDCRVIGLDPWPALKSLFRASRQEFNLLAPSAGGSRTQLAYPVLRALENGRAKGEVLPPAPGGVLTNDHLFTVLARMAFGFEGEISAHQVALWSTRTDAAEVFTSWVSNADPDLAAELLSWMAQRLGRLGEVFVEILRTVGPADIVPLGLIAALLDDTTTAAVAFPAPSEVLVRTRTLLEVHLGGRQISEQELIAWGNIATLAISEVTAENEVLRRTDQLVDELAARELVGRSEVLPAGLPPRTQRVAGALSDAGLTPSDDARARVEDAWADLLSHRDSHADTRSSPRDVRVAAGAIRLWRWLQTVTENPAGLADWVDYYRRELSYVDGAVNDVYIGAHDSVLAAFADLVVSEVRSRRSAQDRAFARLLASSGAHHETGPRAPLYVEDVLDRIVRPITAPRSLEVSSETTRTPVLLIVADGMSAAVAGEVVADALARHRPQWQECRLSALDAVAAVAALPTLTQFSRCSLLSGRLQRGQAVEESREFSKWLASHGMAPAGKALFHKGDLDAVSRGNALASEVRTAVEDTKHRPVVACVLNDIDDALDRSDPIGTTWDVSSFKHLDPLLNAAAAVGRIVLLLSDHGHVPERREQPSAQRGQQVSARYRPADGVDVAKLPADEVLLDGPRVLCDGHRHRAVLAVDEQLRYTALKAGYHGGASPAEVVIPISILVNGAIPEHLALEPAPMTAPAWWSAPPPSVPQTTTASTLAPKARPKKPARQAPQEGTLFDTETLRPPTDADPASADAGTRDMVDELLRSVLFNQQFQTFGRYLKRPQVGALIRDAINAGGVLPLTRAAQLLGVKTTRVGGAVSLVAQLLNTDGVEVLTINGTDLILKQSLMFEQFGVTAHGGKT